jgi:hypothetical protein
MQNYNVFVPNHGTVMKKPTLGIENLKNFKEIHYI